MNDDGWDLSALDAPTPAPAPEAKPAPAAPKRNDLRREKRAMEKLIAVQRATEEERAATATLLGVPAGDHVRLALACLGANRQLLASPAKDVLYVADAGDPLEAMERAVMLATEKPQRFEVAVRLLRTVTDVPPVPQGQAKAARLFTQVARRLTDSERAALQPSRLI